MDHTPMERARVFETLTSTLGRSRSTTELSPRIGAPCEDLNPRPIAYKAIATTAVLRGRDGAGYRNRTRDPLITIQMLYLLS